MNTREEQEQWRLDNAWFTECLRRASIDASHNKETMSDSDEPREPQRRSGKTKLVVRDQKIVMERVCEPTENTMSDMISLAVNSMPREYRIALRDMIDELLWEIQHLEQLRIYNDRYLQLTQEAALTIAQAVKVRHGNKDREITKLPVEKEP